MPQHDDKSEICLFTSHPSRPSGFRGAFQFRANRYPWGKAMGASLTMGICILIGALAGHVEWGLLATVGGFTSVYVHHEPYAQRAMKLVVVGIGLAASFGFGTLSAGHAWSMALVLGLVSMCATFLAGAWRVPPPSGYFFILVCALGTGLPVDPASAPFRFGIALFGGGVAWVICMSGWFLHPHKPEESAVSKAYREVAVFLAATHHVDAARHNAAIALQASEDAVSAARQVRWRRPGTSYRLYLLHEKAKALFLAGIAISAEDDGPISPRLSASVRAIADVIKEPEEAGRMDIPKPPTDTPVRWRAYHELVDTLAIAVKPASDFNQTLQLERRPTHLVLSAALERHSLVLPGVLRVGIVVVLATVISHLLGNSRPYWVPLTCASVLQGATAVATLHRTIQRALGTLMGVFVGGAILFSHPSVGWMIVLLMALQMLVELIIVRNYGLAVIFITPLPLILAEVGYLGLQPSALLQARIFDTLLGCAIGLMGAVVLWRRASSVRLPVVLGRAIRLEARLLHTWLCNGDSVNPVAIAQEQKAVQTALMNMRVMYDATLSEFSRHRRSLESLWPAVASIERIGYVIIAGAAHHPGDSTGTAASSKFVTLFEKFATAVERGQAPKPEEVFGIPAFPAIQDELNGLREALEVWSLDHVERGAQANGNRP